MSVTVPFSAKSCTRCPICDGHVDSFVDGCNVYSIVFLVTSASEQRPSDWAANTPSYVMPIVSDSVMYGIYSRQLDRRATGSGQLVGIPYKPPVSSSHG